MIRPQGLAALLFAVLMVTASSPTGSAAGNPLPDTSSGIHFGLPFNHTEYARGTVQQEEAGSIDLVFGAANQWTMHNVPAGRTWHGFYIPWSTDPIPRSGATQWFLKNHPDWLEYRADRKTPAYYGPSQEKEQSQPTLDFTNPSVQQYLIHSFVDPAVSGGFDGISFDDTLVANHGRAAGHFDLHGGWVEQYSGSEAGNQAFVQAQARAYRQLAAQIKAAHPSVLIAFNNGIDCSADPALWRLAGRLPDIVVDEQGLTAWGVAPYFLTSASTPHCPNAWLDKMQEYEYLQKTLGKSLFLINQEPYRVSSFMTTTNARARFDLRWALANYLLIKYRSTYFWWGGEQQYGDSIAWQPEYGEADGVGSPTGDFYIRQGVYMRDYSNGLVLVNPDPTHSYRLRFAGVRYGLHGRLVTAYAMPPHSGLILLDALGPCRPGAAAGGAARLMPACLY